MHTAHQTTMSKQDQDSELRKTAESWAKLLRLNDREAWKIASNFSIAGAVLVTAVTIARKDLSTVVNNTTKSGTPSTINVRVVDLPDMKLPEMKVKIANSLGDLATLPVRIETLGSLQSLGVDINSFPPLGLNVRDQTPRLLRP